MLSAGELKAWRAAAADLGINVDIGDDAVTIRDFGAMAGMLCAIRRTSDGIQDLSKRAQAAGMGWSALGPGYDDYNRELFIDTLNDWGWTGAGDPPAWYSGKPWTE